MDLPTGTVTFFFTDIEGSTGLLHALGHESYGHLQDEHSVIMREAIDQGSGVEIRTEGDAFFAVFGSPAGAVLAATEAQKGSRRMPGPTDRRSASGSACTPARARSAVTTTSGSTSTGRLASPRWAMAARWSSRRLPPVSSNRPCPTAWSCATWGFTVSRTSPIRCGSTIS